jgi:hypothetical protein
MEQGSFDLSRKDQSRNQEAVRVMGHWYQGRKVQRVASKPPAGAMFRNEVDLFVVVSDGCQYRRATSLGMDRESLIGLVRGNGTGGV